MSGFPGSLRLGLKQTAELDQSRLLIRFQPDRTPATVAALLAAFSELSRETGEDSAGGPTQRLNEDSNHLWVRVKREHDRDLVAALRREPDVAWVGPVYRLPNEPGLLGLFCPPPGHLLLEPAHHLLQEAAALAAALANVGLTEVAERSRFLGDYRFCVVSDGTSSVYELAAQLESSGIALNASFDAIPLVSPLQMATPIGETFWPQQNLVDIHMPAAWDLPAPFGAMAPNLGRPRVYACLIDCGAQSMVGGHPEIARAGNFGWDASTGTSGAAFGAPTAPGTPEGAHGTACAGIIGAEWETVPGVVGIAPLSGLFSLAIGTPAALSDVVSAINAAVATVLPNADPGGTADRDKEHRRVILLSVVHAAFASTPALSTAIANALAADVPVVIPTGNGDAASIPYPASEPGVITVGAVYTAGTRATGEPLGHGTNNGGVVWGSNYSPTLPFVSAPGFALKTSDLSGAQGYAATNYVQDFQGTSAAAAHAAGLSALLLAHNPRLLASDVRAILYKSAEKIGGAFSPSDANHPDGTWNQNVGYGRIHAQNAVIEARKVRADVSEITGPSPTICEFGDVTFRRTQQIEIRLRHTATLCTRPITFVLPTVLPAHCQWATGTLASYVVASGTDQSVFLQYVAPSAVEDISGTITFLTDDYLKRSISLSVHAKSVAPPVVDSCVVLDRSGSMIASTTDPSKNRSQVVADATSLYINLLEDEDHLGIVRFSTTAVNPGDVLIGMTLAGPMGSRTALLNSLVTGNPLDPQGSTSIGGGMILGSQILDTQPSAGAGAPPRALVVMTDGEQNTLPDYPPAHAQIAAAANGTQRVFAVGVGLSRVDPPFDAIVTVSGGYAFPTGPAVSDAAVNKMFMAILANAADSVFATDPDYTISYGQKQATPVVIGETDFQVDFVVLSSLPRWFPGPTHIWLEAPDGTVIEAADILAGTVPNFRGAAYGCHVVLRVLLPAFANPTQHIGTWRVWVEYGAFRDAKEQNTRVLAYSAMATVKSDLKLKGHLTHPSRLPGDPFAIVLEPTLFGTPVELSGSPEARVTRPDGSVFVVPLARNAGRTYEALFSDTGLPGVYAVNAEVQATTPNGIVLTRYLPLRTVVEGAGSGTIGGGEEGGPRGGPPPTRKGCLCGFVGFFCRLWRGCCRCSP